MHSSMNSWQLTENLWTGWKDTPKLLSCKFTVTSRTFKVTSAAPGPCSTISLLYWVCSRCDAASFLLPSSQAQTSILQGIKELDGFKSTEELTDRTALITRSFSVSPNKWAVTCDECFDLKMTYWSSFVCVCVCVISVTWRLPALL